MFNDNQHHSWMHTFLWFIWVFMVSMPLNTHVHVIDYWTLQVFSLHLSSWTCLALTVSIHSLWHWTFNRVGTSWLDCFFFEPQLHSHSFVELLFDTDALVSYHWFAATLVHLPHRIQGRTELGALNIHIHA